MGLRDDNGALEGDGTREVERALRLERAKTRAWLHDRPLQMLELIAAGGYHDDADAAWLRHLAGKASAPLLGAKCVGGNAERQHGNVGHAIETLLGKIRSEGDFDPLTGDSRVIDKVLRARDDLIARLEVTDRAAKRRRMDAG